MAGGGFLYLTAIDLAGAAKTAVLGAASPIFGTIGAMIFSAQAPWTARYPGDADLLRRDHPGGLSEGYREQACGSGRRV